MAQPVTDDELWQRKRARRRLVGAVVLVLLVVVFLPWVLDDKPKPLTKNVDIQIPAIDPPEKKFGAPATQPSTPPATATPPIEPVPSPATSPSANGSDTNTAITGSTSAPAIVTPDENAVASPSPSITEPAPAPSAPITSTAPVEMKPEPAAPVAQKKTVGTGDEKKPAPADKPAAKKPVVVSTGKYVVPLGTFSKEENARKLVQRVKNEGLPVYLERFRSAEGSQLRVRLGPFVSEGSAERARKLVVQKGIAPGPTKVISLE